ncbi:granulocyte-macrophage colony-stimulating factor receptor subunit alpha-like [Phyllostomus discolor]|uniref:Granulocyte-macrophage colony-stimulating factor receptor subunit alpha-like n=1 Tax=Phyllostomus discolor TaxID=89673 RepID=A0A7E6D1N7_9CHIR|nr:granulocyte-macrophage colony-stimulating factor receptor subunit alpha-like [Phyllostomus discolor]
MAFLLGLASLLVVPLSSARCADPLPAEENESPVINLKLDPWKKLLTWSYQTNVTEQECQIDTPPSSSTRQIPESPRGSRHAPGVAGGPGPEPGPRERTARGRHPCPSPCLSQPGDQDEYSCHFPNAVLHRGANLTVHGTADGAAFRCALHFHNAGREGSGAVNFSCVIYNVQLLNCSWAPGPAAPADVQYQLHCWACRGEEEIECPHYMLDGAGTRVGCHFGALPEPQLTDKYIFLLNGTSPEAGVRFVDFPPFRAIQMEKLNPPANLTVDYNGSHHIVQWDNPEMRFDLPRSSLCYEVDVQVAGTSSQEDPVSICFLLCDVHAVAISPHSPALPTRVPRPGCGGPASPSGLTGVRVWREKLCSSRCWLTRPPQNFRFELRCTPNARPPGSSGWDLIWT